MEKIKVYKKANNKAGAEVDPKDPTKQKWNDTDLFIRIENEYVPLSELAKLAKENEYVPIPEMVENEMEIGGTVHNVSDLIERYQAKKNEDAAQKEIEKGEGKGEGSSDVVVEKKAAKKNLDLSGMAAKDKMKGNEKEEEDKEKKDNEVAGAVEDNEDENAKAAAGKKNKEEKEDDEKENEKEEDEEKEETMHKNNGKSKDVRHFIRLNNARENGDAGGNVLTIDTMHNRIDRGKNRYGTSK